MTDLTQYPIGTIFLSRDNARFKLIAVDDDRNYPIHCCYNSCPGMGGEFTFTKTGKFRTDGLPSYLDLVSVEKPLDLSNLGFGDLVERTDGVTGCVTRTAHDSLKIEWQDDKPPSIVTPRGFKGANRIVKTIKFHHPRPVYTCTATVDVEADSEAQARAIVSERFNCAPDNVTAKRKG